MAKLVSEKSDIQYQGFDFSSVAVEKARHLLKESGMFYECDATEKGSYPYEYQAVVCTEVLEHLEDDIKVIGNWKPGATCICSVPNYDSDYHVRFFHDRDEVEARYGDLLEIDFIMKIRKPVLTDLSFSNCLRQLRWNRYRPKQFLKLLGITNFDQDGRWFLFVGKKR